MAKSVHVTLDGLRQLRRRVDKQQLANEDWAVVGALVSHRIHLTEARMERMAAKVAASQASAAVVEGQYTIADSPAEHPKEAPPQGPAAAGAPPDTKEKPKGHGRNGAGAYVNAKHFFHALASGLIGALCAACGVGRITRYREKVVVRVLGQPLFRAEVHHLEQGRCRLCGALIRAEGPPYLKEGLGTPYVMYDWSACAFLIVMHYDGNLPLKRMESFHEGWGVPFADANQWTLLDRCDELLLPLYNALELYGAKHAVVMRLDDTASKVLSLMRQIQEELAALKLLGESTKSVRTGINATGVYFETDKETIALFYTGRHHAGEIVDGLLKHRPASAPRLVKVTDAASKNFDHAEAEKLIEASCNAHGFLKFQALRDKFPAEYAIAGEVYKKVFDNDDEAAARGLTPVERPVERMLFHREHSKPLMEKLKAMCEAKISNKSVEPNSPLWEPLTFIINQWDRLTRFYEVPGVPLDTNVVERLLILPVRYLAASLCFKTLNGAQVADRLMSLVRTARENGVEPVNYLAHCLCNHDDLAKRPEHYFPWAYRDRLQLSTSPPPTPQHAPAPTPA